VGSYIWYSEEGPGLAVAPPSPFLTIPNVTAHRPGRAAALPGSLLAIPNVTAHPSMASVWSVALQF